MVYMRRRLRSSEPAEREGWVRARGPGAGDTSRGDVAEVPRREQDSSVRPGEEASGAAPARREGCVVWAVIGGPALRRARRRTMLTPRPGRQASGLERKPRERTFQHWLLSEYAVQQDQAGTT